MADVCDLKAVIYDPLAFGYNDNTHRKKTHRVELKTENQTKVQSVAFIWAVRVTTWISVPAEALDASLHVGRWGGGAALCFPELLLH